MSHKKGRNRQLPKHLWPLGLTVVPLVSVPAGAAESITVDSSAQEATAEAPDGLDNGNCTLGEAILAANLAAANPGNPQEVGGCSVGAGGPPYTIVLESATYTLTARHNARFGYNGLPAVTGEIVIDGNGAIIGRSGVVGTPTFRLYAV